MTFSTEKQRVKFMTKPLMSASFMWYTTSCFDVALKRERSQQLRGARVPGSTQAPAARRQAQSPRTGPSARGSAVTREKLTTCGSPPSTFPRLKLPGENRVFTASCFPPGAHIGLSWKGEEAPGIGCHQPLSSPWPPAGHLPTSHGVTKPVCAPPAPQPSCTGSILCSPSSARMEGPSPPAWHALLPYAAPGPWLLLSMPASPRLCRQAEPFFQGLTGLPAGPGSSPSPSALRLPSLSPASPPFSRLLPWGVSQQLSN